MFSDQCPVEELLQDVRFLYFVKQIYVCKTGNMTWKTDWWTFLVV
jgi:hypothetical protein